MVVGTNDRLQDLVAFCRSNGRVCPVPTQWDTLWELLPHKRRAGVGWQPSLPLILAAWWHTDDSEKMSRLEEHLRWAANNDALGPIEQFLHSLSEDRWHHLGE